MKTMLLPGVFMAFTLQAADNPVVNSAAVLNKQTNFVNSLGMQFVLLDDSKIKVSIWETRVIDFLYFVCDTGYGATKDMESPAREGWGKRGHSWIFPGFPQFPNSPVCGVNYHDAIAFCEWLTKKEKIAGRLIDNQHYRLPTSEEWHEYAGNRRFPWGNQFPPVDNDNRPLVNVGGDESYDGNRPDTVSDIKGYNDHFPRTSPVASFPANEFGIFDTGGNVIEWSSSDWKPTASQTSENSSATKQYKIILGSGWNTGVVDHLQTWTGSEFPSEPSNRSAAIGFRVILAEK